VKAYGSLVEGLFAVSEKGGGKVDGSAYNGKNYHTSIVDICGEKEAPYRTCYDEQGAEQKNERRYRAPYD
jgi:hypothetical protein